MRDEDDIDDTVQAAGTTICNVAVNSRYRNMRIMFTIVIVGITVWSLVKDFGVAWFFYITHWGLIINLIYMCSVSYLHMKILQGRNNDGTYKSIDDDELNLRSLWNWTLFWLNLGVSIATFIIILYWTRVWDHGAVNPITWNTHGTVGVLIIFEYMTSTWRLTKKGVLFVFVVAVAWIGFSIVFSVAGKKIVIHEYFMCCLLFFSRSTNFKKM